MPFKSEAQRRLCWFKYNQDIKAGQTPKWDCPEWERETKRVGSKSRKASKRSTKRKGSKERSHRGGCSKRSTRTKRKSIRKN